MEFLDCQAPEDFKGNKTARDEAGHGCWKVSVCEFIMTYFSSHFNAKISIAVWKLPL